MKTLAAAGDLAEIRGRIELLTPMDARQWGSMYVRQMVCHLSDSFEAAMGERAVTPLKPAMPRPVMKWFALRFPRQWPRGVETVPELNQRMGAGTRPDVFSTDCATLLKLLDRFAASPQLSPTHAIFGGMTREDWMRWGYLHCDHHLRQFAR